jgi:NADH-quinone oxidoreductase subunit L
MNWIINIFILIPLVGFILSLLIAKDREVILSRIASGTAGVNLLLFVVFVVYWIIHNHPILSVKDIVLYRTTGYEFLVNVFFDEITAVYMFVGSFLTFLITIYSRYYLHR